VVQVQKSTKYYITKIRKNQSYGVFQDVYSCQTFVTKTLKINR